MLFYEYSQETDTFGYVEDFHSMAAPQPMFIINFLYFFSIYDKRSHYVTMKNYKILSYTQILVIVCLAFFSAGIPVNSFRKSGEFPCKEHHCGCKSEFDCKTHCCCAPDENQNKFRNNSKNQNGFKTFISSINCKYGNDPLTTISFTAKYMLNGKVLPIKESFLCFLFNDTSINLPEVFTSPPEKPPKLFT